VVLDGESDILDKMKKYFYHENTDKNIVNKNKNKNIETQSRTESENDNNTII